MSPRPAATITPPSPVTVHGPRHPSSSVFSWSAHRDHRMLMFAGTDCAQPGPPLGCQLAVCADFLARDSSQPMNRIIFYKVATASAICCNVHQHTAPAPTPTHTRSPHTLTPRHGASTPTDHAKPPSFRPKCPSVTAGTVPACCCLDGEDAARWAASARFQPRIGTRCTAPAVAGCLPMSNGG